MTDNDKENNNGYDKKKPLAAWFLGPKAEHGDIWEEMLTYILRDYVHWRRNYFPEDPILINRIRKRSHDFWFDNLSNEIDKILNHLKAHFPFYSPRYNAHMLSEQTLPGVLGYFSGMLYNPNNVTDESAPITVPLEIEVGKMIAEMLGYNPRTSWAHICSGGTIANIEALWVARTVKFIPLMVQEFCQAKKINFRIKTPAGKPVNLGSRDYNVKDTYKILIHLKPGDSSFMIRKLAKYLVEEHQQVKEKMLEEINTFIKKSQFNINRRGIREIHNRINMNPRIFISESAHYSIKKAVNLLGYGEEAIRPVPVDAKFRMRIDALQEMLEQLKEDEYIAAVIGIVGTTEEGAVDPIHRIKSLKEEYHKQDKSFWFHVDAAWGGYIRSLFCGHTFPKTRARRNTDDMSKDYIEALDLHEQFTLLEDTGEDSRNREKPRQSKQQVTIRWDDAEVYSAFLAVPAADSITIDPHKLGYIPYPAGVIAFKNRCVTDHIVQKAQYISEEREGVSDIKGSHEIDAVGPYIIEGSKPGAAAAACWLAHKTIPLNVDNHGKIMKTTLLNTRKFFIYLNHHKKIFNTLETELFGSKYLNKPPFTFKPLYKPDTNITCFIAVPMAWKEGKLIETDYDLEWLNELNEKIYQALTIKSTKENLRTPCAQDYFVSRTRLEIDQYSADSIKDILKELRISPKDYKQRGLFVLRATIMNPFHYLAYVEGKDYLFDFLKSLHKKARTALLRLDDTCV